ncbi:MAG: RNA methyltransferase [Chloroflexota bacterium]
MQEKLKEDLAEWLARFVTLERNALLDKVLNQRTRHFTAVLENIFQPHNASAVLRSCDIFGVQDVHIIEDRFEYTVNPDVAMGASRWLTLHRYGDPEPLPEPGMRGLRAYMEEVASRPSSTADCLNQLKQNGYTVVATSLRPGAVSLYDLPIDRPLAICFGTEETGLSDEAHDLADVFMTIPMYGFTQSFNISVSAALTFQKLTHDLRESSLAWQIPPEQRLDILVDWLLKSATRGDALARQFFRDRDLPIPEIYLEPEEEEDSNDR